MDKSLKEGKKEMNFQLTSQALSAIVGIVLSLGFSYIPGLSTKYAALSSELKSLIMAGLLLVTSGAIFGLGCGGIIQNGLTCDQNGLVQLVGIFVSALISNQATYVLSPQTQAVKNALASR